LPGDCVVNNPLRIGWQIAVAAIAGGKMKLSADERSIIGLEHASPTMVLIGGSKNRTGALRCLLAELQDEARDVFAGSGETVDRFLGERQNEARREVGLPA
jgi:hypothetical protein